MFALGLWDRAQRRLTLARDRFGEKPLYYGWVGANGRRAFVFGSELKALRAHPAFDNAVDRGALALFLRYSYVPTPYSIYENIFKLEPGCMLSLDASAVAGGERVPQPYYRFPEVACAALANPFFDEREGLERLEAALREAVALQLVADVPIGAFLSGGVNSSIIVALMQEQSARAVETFTVGFDEAGYDEAPAAAAVARHLGTNHHEIRVSPAETLAIIPGLPETYDEPFADSSQVPTSIICASARRSVTVALSGDAGDELLGGYNRYVFGPRLWKNVAWAPRWARRAAGAALSAVPVDYLDRLGRLPPLGQRISMLGRRRTKSQNPSCARTTSRDCMEASWRNGTRARRLPSARRHCKRKSRQRGSTGSRRRSIA